MPCQPISANRKTDYLYCNCININKYACTYENIVVIGGDAVDNNADERIHWRHRAIRIVCVCVCARVNEPQCRFRPLPNLRHRSPIVCAISARTRTVDNMCSVRACAKRCTGKVSLRKLRHTHARSQARASASSPAARGVRASPSVFGPCRL